MKLRYKKIVLSVLISTMGIGVITLSVNPNNHVKESMKYTNTQEKVTPEITAAATITPSVLPTIPALTVTPTIAPSPVSLPVYNLESEGYPEINKLMKAYYSAKLKSDKDKLKTLVSDPNDIPSQNKLKNEVQFYEDYSNIKCYVKKSYQEGTYIVFTYYEIKIYNIKTLVPALTEYYVITDNKGNLKIVSGELDQQTYDYCKARKKDADVVKLSDQTDAKLKNALKKDKTLKTFYNNLVKLHNKKGN